MHTFNNLVAFGSLVLLQQDTSSVFDRGAGSAGPAVLLPGVILLLSAGALWLWASRTGLQRRYAPDQPALDGTGGLDLGSGGHGRPGTPDPHSTYVGPWAQPGR